MLGSSRTLSGCLALTVLCAAVVGISGATVSSSAHSSIHSLSVKDIQPVFFGGFPWLIICNGGSEPVPKVLYEAASLLYGNVSVGVMDCNEQLPSGKTIAERAKLNTGVVPTVFLAGNGRPRQIMPTEFASVLDDPSGGAVSAEMNATKLARLARRESKPSHTVLDSNATFVSACWRQRHRACAVVRFDRQGATKQQKAVLKALMKKYRGIQFTILDPDDFRIEFPYGDVDAVVNADAPVLLFRPHSLNPLSAALKHGELWEEKARVIPAAFGHGYGSPLEDRLLKYSHVTTLDAVAPHVPDDVDAPPSHAAVPHISMSLCRHELSGLYGVMSVDLAWPGFELSAQEMALFKLHELAAGDFLRNPHQARHPDAVFLVDGRAMDYKAASSYIFTAALAGQAQQDASAGGSANGSGTATIVSSSSSSSSSSKGGVQARVAASATWQSTEGLHDAVKELANAVASRSEHGISVAAYDGDFSFKTIAKWLESTLSAQQQLLHVPTTPTLHALGRPRKSSKGGKKAKKAKKSKAEREAARSGRASFADADAEEAEEAAKAKKGGKKKGGSKFKPDVSGTDGSGSKKSKKSSSRKPINASKPPRKAGKRSERSKARAQARAQAKAKAQTQPEVDPDNTRTRTAMGERPPMKPIVEAVPEFDGNAYNLEPEEPEPSLDDVDEVIVLDGDDGDDDFFTVEEEEYD